MKVSQFGVDFIKSFEGLKLKAYKAHKSEKYYTIGYGHYGKDVKPDMVITEQEAAIFLVADLRSSENAVNRYTNKYIFNQHEFDALVSFTFNCGSGNLDQLLNKGKRSKKEIAEKILLYNKCNGTVLSGLTKRRKKERDLFLMPYESLEVIAKEVIAGKWGNGEERKKRLTAAGYDYDTIQAIVNLLLRRK